MVSRCDVPCALLPSALPPACNMRDHCQPSWLYQCGVGMPGKPSLKTWQSPVGASAEPQESLKGLALEFPPLSLCPGCRLLSAPAPALPLFLPAD